MCAFANALVTVAGSTYPLEAALKNGGSRDQPTVATLSVTPAREDDGAVFRCVVWNRAMPEGSKLETTVALSVNCEYNCFCSTTDYISINPKTDT